MDELKQPYFHLDDQPVPVRQRALAFEWLVRAYLELAGSDDPDEATMAALNGIGETIRTMAGDLEALGALDVHELWRTADIDVTI